MATIEQWSDGELIGTLDVPDPEPEHTAQAVAAQVIAEEIDTRLAPSAVNSIAEVKTAIRDGLAAAVERLA